MKFFYSICLPFILALMMPNLVASQETLEMEGTSITGNRELPKILTIVPWKPAQPVSPSSTEINSILDLSLKPLNRSEFKRRINYHQVLFSTQKSIKK